MKDLGRPSVTIGIANFPRDASEVRELVAKADEAMYAGKRAGKNCICVFGDEANIIRLRQPAPQGA
jgi:GGDEF domain-containing protein